MPNTISGNVGISGVTVVAVGYATGTLASTTSTTGGAYTISGLGNDTYFISPALTGNTFSPYVSQQTISGSNITGVNFTQAVFTPTQTWTKYGDVNLLTPSSTPGSTLAGCQPGTVLYEASPQLIVPPVSGLVFKAYYMDGQNLRYAESPDGITWTQKSGNIIAARQWVTVFKFSGTYYLYCTDTGSSHIQVYTATDGVTFTQQNASALTVGSAGQWDSGFVYQLTVCSVVSGTWTALYTGLAKLGLNSTISMGIATSTDGINWTKAVSGNPVIFNASAPCVVKVGSTYYCYYNGTPFDQSIGGAVQITGPSDVWRIQSTNLTTWTNPIPVLPRSHIGEGVGSANGQTGNPWIVGGSSSCYLFYMGSNEGFGVGVTASNFKFMLATANIGLSALVQTNEGILSTPQIAVDTFQRANENPLSNGGKWGTLASSTFGGLQLISDLAAPPNTSTWGLSVYSGAVFPGNSYAETVVQKGTVNSPGSQLLFLCVLLHASNGTGGQDDYQLNVLSGTNLLGASGTLTVNKLVNGATTQLSSFTATPNIGDVWRLEYVNGTLNVRQNGNIVNTVNDNTYASGSPGIQAYNAAAATDSEFGAWEGGGSVPASLPVLPINAPTGPAPHSAKMGTSSGINRPKIRTYPITNNTDVDG